MYIIKKEFRLTSEEIEAIKGHTLKPRSIDKKLAGIVHSAYNRTIHKHIDMKVMQNHLDLLEMKRKWPSGSRMLAVEARLLLLKWLIESRPKLSNTEAAEFFHGLATNGRESYRVMSGYIYQFKS